MLQEMEFRQLKSRLFNKQIPRFNYKIIGSVGNLGEGSQESGRNTDELGDTRLLLSVFLFL